MRELRQRIITVLRDGTAANGKPLKAKDVILQVLALYGFTSEESLNSEAGRKKKALVACTLSNWQESKRWARVAWAKYAPLGWSSKKEGGAN